MDLFDQQVIPVKLGPELGASNIIFWPIWLSGAEANQLLNRAMAQTDWRQDSIRIAGKTIPLPRLQNWFGDPATSYTYSGIRLQAVSFPDWMERLRLSVEDQTGQQFNRALVNYYRHGRDSVDWHADDEASLGFEPLIASVSVGAERIFQLRHNVSKEKVKINLPHGSLLLMGAGVQENWQHSVAKVKQLDEPRVNFTFRYMASNN